MRAFRQVSARSFSERTRALSAFGARVPVLIVMVVLGVAPDATLAQTVPANSESPLAGPVQTTWPTNVEFVPVGRRPTDDSPSPDVPISGRLAPLTFAGAFAGSYVGQRVAFTAALQTGGVGSGGIASLLLLTTAGSVLGSATGATLFSGQQTDRTFKRAAGGALMGTVLGLMAGFAGLETTEDVNGWLIGYALGQATATTLAVHGG